MIKVMIADDEQYERDYLNKIISERYKNLLQVVYMAKDGAEVLEVAEECKPDIILLDIRMPRLDGLEAAAQLMRRNPELQLVIISAYGEFSYAKQAMKAGVKDFLVKPYLDEELVETLDKVIASMGASARNDYELLEHSEETFDFYEDMDKDLVWDAALERKHGTVLLKEVMMWGAHDNSFKCITLYNDSILEMGTTGYDIIRGIFYLDKTHVIISYLFRQIVVYVFAENDSVFNDINACIRKARNYLKEFGKTTVYCGVSGIYEGCDNMKTAYQEALNYILEFSDIQTRQRLQANMELTRRFCDMEDKVCFYVAGKNEEQSIYWLKQIMALFAEASGGSESFIRQNLRRTFLSIIRKINRIPEMRIRTKDAVALFERFAQWSGAQEEEESFLLEIISFLMQNIKGSLINSNTLVVRGAKEYIEKHFGEALSLQNVSEALNISAGYLSKCFKNQCQISFTEYLTNYRLERAREMMRAGGESITEIAYQVGFSDPNYFGKCFKKKEGVSPKEFCTMQSMALPKD
ncbi:MAG: response regulator [Lachnospiraceae bacterium]|nr:response regulator [Lachnospiraceae bacterium]